MSEASSAMETIRIDAEFSRLIPPLTDQERAGLEASIVAEGCREALVVWAGQGILLDGHNRYAICQQHGVEFRVVEREFSNRTAAFLWVIDNQQHRRNLADIDKIALARKREEIAARKAKANQRQSRGPKAKKEICQQCGTAHWPEEGCDKGSAILPNLSTRQIAAASAGVGERTYDAGKLILDAAEKGEIPPETMRDLRERRTSIHRVAKHIKDTRAKAQRQKKRVEAAAKVEAKPDQRIIIGDFRTFADRVPDGSVSLIFTDPPYDREAEAMLAGLADFAAAKLADGGSIIFYAGHLQLPAAFAAFHGKLRHWWTCACVHSGDKALMREYGVRVGWKPMLWFVKGTRDDKSKIVHDMVTGATEKSHHDWQQAESEAARWIEDLCQPDGLVVDPFLGGGTTAVAAKSLGRKWVGFEINADTARIAAGRIAE